MSSLLDVPLFLFFRADDAKAFTNASLFIEEGQWHDLKKGYRARSDLPHATGMQHHNHLYLKGNQVAVINRDGTPSHGTNINDVPRHVIKSLKSKGLVETSLYIETAADEDIRFVPPDVIEEAIASYDNIARLRRLFDDVR